MSKLLLLETSNLCDQLNYLQLANICTISFDIFLARFNCLNYQHIMKVCFVCTYQDLFRHLVNNIDFHSSVAMHESLG